MMASRVSTPLYRHPRVIAATPAVTMVLLEAANLSQIAQMWTERTAEGQSLGAWVCVSVALVLWLNFYLSMPEDFAGRRTAVWSTAVGITLNAAVIASVVLFRYVLS